MFSPKKCAFVLIILLIILLAPCPDQAAALTVHERIAGPNRFLTAVEISKAGWSTADTVILARSDNFPDALAGAPLAYFHSAPILITYTASLHSAVEMEIQRLGADHIIILGGTGAISQTVENALIQKGLTVERIGGKNRYETAALIAAKLPSSDHAVLAYGENFPDALAIGPYAARNGWPILLSRSTSLPAETATALVGKTHTLVVGGSSVLSDALLALLPGPRRIAGANRYETAAAINAEFDHERCRAYVATGQDFADALTGSALAAKQSAPMLLVRKTAVPAAVKSLIQYQVYPAFSILGGEGAVNSGIFPDLQGIEHIILRVVYVTTEWSPFTDISGWPGAAPIKEAHGVKYYEAAIWEDGLRVHLYALPNDYDQFYGSFDGLSVAEKVAYRESYCLYSRNGMPAEKALRGEYILETFSEIAAELAERNPYASHNLVYSGHGIWGGELFELHMDAAQANEFLGNWHTLLGKKLGFVDMGTVCLKGSYHDLDAFAEHTDFYIGTDQFAGCAGYNPGYDWSECDPDVQYPRILGTSASMEDALKARIDLAALRYLNSSIHIIADRIKQSCYLYDCSEFLDHQTALAAFMNSVVHPNQLVDVRLTLVDYAADPALISAYDEIILHKADTKSFFTWDSDWNGMLWDYNI